MYKYFKAIFKYLTVTFYINFKSLNISYNDFIVFSIHSAVEANSLTYSLTIIRVVKNNFEMLLNTVFMVFKQSIHIHNYK